MSQRILLFDLDGTLVNTGGAGRYALNRAVWNLHGMRDVCDHFSLAGKTDLRNFDLALRLATGRRPTLAARRRVHREYLRLLPGQVRRAVRMRKYRVTTGIRPLLARLARDSRVVLGLGTGNLEEGARIKLGPSGFNELFRFGGYGSDCYQRPALLKRAVARAKPHLQRPVAKRRVYVIGDTPLDVSAGRAAGYRTIAVGTGFSPWQSLVDARPDFLAKDFKGVGKWMRWLEL